MYAKKNRSFNCLLIHFATNRKTYKINLLCGIDFRIVMSQAFSGDGDISWTVTFRGHYFSKWATFRGHSQRVTSRGHYFSKWVTSRGQF